MINQQFNVLGNTLTKFPGQDQTPYIYSVIGSVTLTGSLSIVSAVKTSNPVEPNIALYVTLPAKRFCNLRHLKDYNNSNNIISHIM